MLGAGMSYKRTLSQKCLSQARRFCYKPKSRNGRPSPVTNPAFLIHGRSSNTMLGPVQSLNPLRDKPTHVRTLFSQTQTCIRGGARGAAAAILDVSPGLQNPELQLLRPHQSCSGNDTTLISMCPATLHDSERAQLLAGAPQCHGGAQGCSGSNVGC